ncbi:hypothetical protein M422DRAFT_276396 [Sphaerobolus stellatus SS14]|uniref:Beta-lactamase-related domain-containing protein n=1 Tax=Sphaerobolus stellatus (strain SS14) TaxID=990650 RepID=A0A0C9UDA4_SPHS4|nr:hypothetical protein M422DRAFT_276396 [Sphaerobolus stellatus SS14]
MPWLQKADFVTCTCISTSQPVAAVLDATINTLGVPFQLHGSDRDQRRLKPVLDEEFEGWLNEKGAKWGMQGDGWETELKGYGIADRWGNPVDEETLFSIASNSKLFTALAIGLLVEDEKYPVNWNMKIKDLLPRLNGSCMTAFRGMTLGTVGQIRCEAQVLSFSTLNPQQNSEKYGNIIIIQMYAMANYIVELLTNQTFTEFVTEKTIKNYQTSWDEFFNISIRRSNPVAYLGR